MTLAIGIASFGLASIQIAIAILWNTKILEKIKAKLLFIPMGGLRVWVWVAESTRRARTTEVFILRTNRPLIHSSRCQPYLYPSTIIKVKIQFLVNVYRVWKQGLENQSGYFI